MAVVLVVVACAAVWLEAQDVGPRARLEVEGRHGWYLDVSYFLWRCCLVLHRFLVVYWMDRCTRETTATRIGGESKSVISIKRKRESKRRDKS